MKIQLIETAVCIKGSLTFKLSTSLGITFDACKQELYEWPKPMFSPYFNLLDKELTEFSSIYDLRLV